jgi:hypothetical protein
MTAIVLARGACLGGKVERLSLAVPEGRSCRHVQSWKTLATTIRQVEVLTNVIIATISLHAVVIIARVD